MKSFNGFIKLHRQLLEWEWYDDINCRLTLIHCILKANFKDKQWRGYDIKRGSFITSLSKLSDEIGISKQQLRTVLDKLEKTGEINKINNGSNTLIIVLNYSDYQDVSKENPKPTNTLPTQDQHTTNTGVTQDQQQLKKEKKDKEETKSKKEDKKK